jgi:hypothetical protein
MQQSSITPFASSNLRQGGEHNDPGLMMIVRNESLKTVLSLPFLAGYA